MSGNRARVNRGESTGPALNQCIPARIGPLRLGARYVAKTQERSGGDVLDAVSTPFGARLMIGDVMGSGCSALESASMVYGGWHRLAQSEPNLAGIAVRLHTLITASLQPEQFVTALLVTLPVGGAPEIICCGHPPPLLIRGEAMTFAAIPSPAPPLGLLDLATGWCASSILPFSAGDRMVLYTDGVTEARDDAGRFYPLLDRVRTLSGEDAPTGEDPWRLVTALETDVLRHAGGRLADDAALLVVDHD